MAVRAAVVAGGLGLLASALAAQTNGSVSGHVRQRTPAGGSNPPISGAQIGVDGRWLAQTDSNGFYRVREVRSGWHVVTVRSIGFETVRRDSVLVRAGQNTVVNFNVDVYTIENPIVVEAYADSILDPTVVASVQRIGGDELRRFPVTTVGEAVALSAGAVGESYRGGRLGEQAFVLDGLGVKNQLDASTGSLGLRIPPDMLVEASLATNGFSARYGQAISGLVNVVTKDGGDRWSGRAAYETDRLLAGAADMGQDRLVLAADGPLGHGIGVAAVLDMDGRLDADPVNAPPPTDPRDPRSANPAMLPHNSGERYDAGAKLRLPLGNAQTLRLFALSSTEQRLLYDPVFKYDTPGAPAQRVSGDLFSADLQRISSNFTADLRAGYFSRDFERGTLSSQPSYRFGAFTGSRFQFIGDDVARRQDTALARAPIAGFAAPDYSERSPWGVPAFFLTGSSGGLAWNQFQELRGQADFSLGSPQGDFYFGGEFASQRVQTFQRALAYLPVGDTVPPAEASTFKPTTAAAYAEGQLRGQDFVVTLGVRYDQFEPGAGTTGGSAAVYGARHSFSPRLGFSTVLKGATFVASWGRFSQAPDFQYLVDAAFDDTLRTGRFRRGNPNLGFEEATQYEFSLRTRPTTTTSLRINVFNKLLDGLIASVPLGINPDSSIFGNLDYGDVKGVEVIAERPLRNGWGLRVSYTLQKAQATATNAFQLTRRIEIGPGGDTINPARVTFPLDYDRRHSVTIIAQGQVPPGAGPRVAGIRMFAGLEAAAIGRVYSGLPYTMTNMAGDSLIGLPNSHRLPMQSTLDMLVRQPIRLWSGRWQGSIYLDVRNVLNRRNIDGLRRESGQPGFTDAQIQQMAETAYAAHPEPIPYESPRYRAYADLNGNGLIEGRSELFPLFLSAAQDYGQPLFSYGPPRLFRIGVELLF